MVSVVVIKYGERERKKKRGERERLRCKKGWVGGSSKEIVSGCKNI